MTKTKSSVEIECEFRQAIKIWVVFIVLLILINGTILFALGFDLHSWTYSTLKGFLFSLVIYASLFLLVPIILVKGWKTVRQPAFLIPLLIAVLGIALTILITPFTASIVIVVLAYLHLRFDLSDLGIKSRGWKGDLIAVFLIGFLGFIPVLLQANLHSLTINNAFLSALTRMFANPASTVENLFYFGFLTERILPKIGKWTPILIGAMYTTHEITNPEYWYGNTSFLFIFLGITIIAAIYIWRRNVVAVWLGDGLGRFLSQLI